MKKLNNKGFAISTMLYGLLIVLILLITMLMGTMSFNRKNSREFTDKLIDELEGNYNGPTPKVEIYKGTRKEDLESNAIAADVPISVCNDGGYIEHDSGKTIDVEIGNQRCYGCSASVNTRPLRDSDKCTKYTFHVNISGATSTGEIKLHMPEGTFYNNNYKSNKTVISTKKFVTS